MPRRITKASPMLDYMVIISVPFARDAYLALSMPGITEDEIGPELESEVPEIFQHGSESAIPKPRTPVMTMDTYGQLFLRDDDVHGLELAAAKLLEASFCSVNCSTTYGDLSSVY